MHNDISEPKHVQDTNGSLLGATLSSGEPIIINYGSVDREIVVSNENALILGGTKSKSTVTSIVTMQIELEEIILRLFRAMANNNVFVQAADGFHGKPISFRYSIEQLMPYDNLINQLVFDLLYDVFLDRSHTLTLNQYCEMRCSDFMESANTLNKLMAAQIKIELGKDGAIHEGEGVYSNIELQSDAHEFGFDMKAYIDEHRSPNLTYIDKRVTKLREYSPRRECDWDLVYYNGKSGLITSKQYRRILEHDSNYSYANFVADYKYYDYHLQELYRPSDTFGNDFITRTMNYYHLEINKRLDGIYKLAVAMENESVSKIDKDHYICRRFYPHVLHLKVENNELHCTIGRKIYRPLIFIEHSWMEQMGMNKVEAGTSLANWYQTHMMRAMVYELARHNYDFAPDNDNEVADFIRKHYNVLGYHDPNKSWVNEETGKLNKSRILNAQIANKALFGVSDKRPPIRKGKS